MHEVEKINFRGEKSLLVLIGGNIYERFKVGFTGASVCLYGGDFYYVEPASGPICKAS